MNRMFRNTGGAKADTAARGERNRTRDDAVSGNTGGHGARRRPDRRVQRTRALLREALMSLIRERGFEGLSVQDIVDRANVGRATFYSHFESKDDLLVSGLEELRTSIRTHQRAGGQASGPFAFGRELFAHAAEHLDVFRAMAGKRSGAVVQQVFQHILLELVRDEVSMALKGKGHRAQEPIARFLAAGLWGLLSWWVDARPRPSVEDVEAQFLTLAAPALEATARLDASREAAGSGDGRSHPAPRGGQPFSSTPRR